MKVTESKILGVKVISPQIFSDERGLFYEWFKQSMFSDSATPDFNLAQANCSVSKKGVLRGIHFAKFPPGQRKYVTCFSGSIFDVVVDLRPNSPTFMQWDSFNLDFESRKMVLIPNGVGHGFLSMEDNSTVAYLCDQVFNLSNEFGINPFDANIGIQWPQTSKFLLSEKDSNAPTLAESMDVIKSFSRL